MKIQYKSNIRKLTAALLIVSIACLASAGAMAVTLMTWDKEQEATIQNYVPGKNLVVKTEAESVNVPLSNVMALRYSANPPAANVPKNSPVLWMASGGWFAISKITFADNQFVFDSAFAGNGKADINSVRCIALQKGIMESAVAGDVKGYLKSPPKSDVMLVLGSQNRIVPLEGVFMQMDDKNVVFQWMEKEQTIAKDKVVAIILAPVKKGEVDSSEFVSVYGNDGSVLLGKLTELSAESAKVEIPGLGIAVVDASKINKIDFTSGRSVQISSLNPKSVEEIPFFDHVFNYRKDTSVGGKPLTLGGVRYEYGLGVHSKCALTYDLEGKYQKLVGVIGIDDAVGRVGNAIFKVIADGKEIYNSGNVKGGDAPKRVSLSVAGVKDLRLDVDFGEDMDIGDHADWADLRLVK